MPAAIDQAVSELFSQLQLDPDSDASDKRKLINRYRGRAQLTRLGAIDRGSFVPHPGFKQCVTDLFTAIYSKFDAFALAMFPDFQFVERGGKYLDIQFPTFQTPGFPNYYIRFMHELSPVTVPNFLDFLEGSKNDCTITVRFFEKPQTDSEGTSVYTTRSIAKYLRESGYLALQYIDNSTPIKKPDDMTNSNYVDLLEHVETSKDEAEREKLFDGESKPISFLGAYSLALFALNIIKMASGLLQMPSVSIIVKYMNMPIILYNCRLRGDQKGIDDMLKAIGEDDAIPILAKNMPIYIKGWTLLTELPKNLVDLATTVLNRCRTKLPTNFPSTQPAKPVKPASSSPPTSETDIDDE